MGKWDISSNYHSCGEGSGVCESRLEIKSWVSPIKGVLKFVDNYETSKKVHQEGKAVGQWSLPMLVDIRTGKGNCQRDRTNQTVSSLTKEIYS